MVWVIEIMDIKAIKELAQTYTTAELMGFADTLESTGSVSCSQKQDCNEIMSDLLQAAEVRGLMDSGLSLQDAVREFSKRVRVVLAK